MSASLPKKTTSPAFQAPSPSDLNGKLSMDRVSTIPSLSSSRPLTPFSKPLTPAPGSLTPPSFKDASFEPSSAAPAPKLPTPASIPLKTSFPSKPPLKPPFFSSAPPKASPPKEKVQVPLEKGGGKENSQKAKIVGAVFGLLLLLVTLPLAVYLVKQRQISPQADEPYPFSCAGLGSDYYCSDSGNCRGECTSAGTPTDCAGGQVCCDSLCMGEPPSGSCDAALQTEAEGRDLCDHGNEAKVYVWATRSQGDGCGDSSVNYTYKESSCCGDRYKDCDTSCSEDQQTHSGTVTIPAGETTSSRQSVSCRIPDDCGETNCASCQVDVDGGGWGQMAWGCQDTPPEKFADIAGPEGIPDGVVDAIDYSVLLANFLAEGAPGTVLGDIAGAGTDGKSPDGVVDAIDYSALLAYYEG